MEFASPVHVGSLQMLSSMWIRLISDFKVVVGGNMRINACFSSCQSSGELGNCPGCTTLLVSALARYTAKHKWLEMVNG